MSINSVGFSAWDTLPANTMLRVTFARRAVFVWDAFDVFPDAVKNLYDRLYPATGIIPSTQLAAVNGDTTAVVDGIVHQATRAADLLNKLDGLTNTHVVVSQVERLNDADRASSSTEDGARDRAAAADSAAANSIWSQLAGHFGDLTTFIKWGGVIVGILGVAYLAHELHGKRD